MVTEFEGCLGADQGCRSQKAESEWLLKADSEVNSRH